MSTRNNGLIKQLIKIFFTVFLDLRDNSFLKNELNAARIRSALMAAIRSIYLWKQSGGSDIKLFIFKGTYVSRLKEINATMQN